MLAGTLDGAAAGLVDAVLAGALAADCDGLAEQPVITAAAATAARAAWAAGWGGVVGLPPGGVRSFMSCSLSRARA